MVPKMVKSKKKPIICITGTPGTGKTTISKELAKELGLKHVELNKIVEKIGLTVGFDKKRNSWIVDEQKITEKVKEMIKKSRTGLIIDSHLAHFLSPKITDLCIICRCNLKVLKGRLEKRRYKRRKINENLEAEIFEICKTEAIENKHKILEIKCSNKEEQKDAIKNIKRTLRDKGIL